MRAEEAGSPAADSPADVDRAADNRAGALRADDGRGDSLPQAVFVLADAAQGVDHPRQYPGRGASAAPQDDFAESHPQHRRPGVWRVATLVYRDSRSPAADPDQGAHRPAGCRGRVFVPRSDAARQMDVAQESDAVQQRDAVPQQDADRLQAVGRLMAVVPLQVVGQSTDLVRGMVAALPTGGWGLVG